MELGSIVMYHLIFSHTKIVSQFVIGKPRKISRYNYIRSVMQGKYDISELVSHIASHLGLVGSMLVKYHLGHIGQGTRGGRQ